MKKFKSSGFKRAGLMLGAWTLLATMTMTGGLAASAQRVPCNGEVWGTDATTVDEAVENAKEIAEQVVAEGQVLLKNNGVLPMAGKEWVSVLSTSGASANSSYISGIESGGFKVFNTTTKDPSKYTDAEKRGHESSDVAIIMVKGVSSAKGDASGPSGGEGDSVASVGDKEDHKDANGQPYKYEDGEPFTHKHLPYKELGGDKKQEYKTSLQLSDTDEEVVKYATENFDKVIVMLTNGSPSEVGILQANKEIDAILLVGSLGAYGYDEIGKVLNGTVNPSGRTVDLWAWDITGRPTWFNDGNANNIFKSPEDEKNAEIKGMAVTSVFRTEGENSTYPYYVRRQHTSADIVPYVYTVMYEEDIYTGYRYYETAAVEAAKDNYDGFVYNHEVLYPFGYGLSYTDFKWEVVGTELSDWGKQQEAYENGGTMTVQVKVTNTGSVAGKDVVQIYGHAPYYMNGVAKAEHELVGFEKTSLIQPGKSETVTIKVNIQDLASYDYTDANGNGKATYELDKVADKDSNNHELHDSVGGYELRVMKNSHDYGNADSKEDMVIKLQDLTNDIILDKDDFAGTKVENLFSGKDINNTLSYDPGTGKTLVEEGKMTLMSRADFAGTQPAVATEAQLVRSDEYYDRLSEFADFNAENWEDFYKIIFPDGTATNEDDSEFEWAVSEAEFKGTANFNDGTNLKDVYGTNTWKQRSKNANLTELQASEDWIWFSDMVGVDYRNGGEELKKWNDFLNQLTWDEMVEWMCNGGRRTAEIKAIAHKQCSYVDATQQMNTSNNFGWGSTYISARTWNKDLTYKRGVTVAEIGLLDGAEAYYAPAVDLHRSPFGGRNDEYWSEDGFLSGHLAGNMLAGVQSTGMMCTIKHFALNENENMRQSLHTYLSEQTLRELYLPAFQICIQEYGSQGVMTAYNTIGDMHATSAYNFNRKLLEDEWDFDGINVSDAADPYKDFYTMDMALRSGLTMLLCDWSAISKYQAGAEGYDGVTLIPTGTYDETANVVKINNGTTVSYTDWFHLRVAVMRTLFAEVNSSIGNNGINVDQYKGDTTLTAATQGAEYEASIGMDGVTADYSITSGELPAGLSVSGGKITGTPTASGEFKVTVAMNSGNYITASKNFVINVASAFELDAEGSDSEVGKEFIGYIISETINTDEGSKYTSVKYSLASDSKLPEGLTLTEDGEISGTPTEAGKFTVNFEIKASTQSQSGSSGGPGGGFPGGGFPGGPGGGQNSAKTFTFTYTFEIAGDETEPPVVTPATPSMRVQNGYIQYSNDGNEWTNVIAVSELKGASGADVQLRVNDGKLQYSNDGSTWTDIMAVADIGGNGGEESGCGSMIDVSTIALLSVIPAAFVAVAAMRRKKKD